jgi:hypothetical protein
VTPAAAPVSITARSHHSDKDGSLTFEEIEVYSRTTGR